MLTGISAITLATHDMARAVAFYETLGFVLKFGGPAARFTSFRVGSGYLNLMSILGNTCGANGAAQSSTLTTLMPSMRKLYLLGSGPNSLRETAHGASGISTFSIRMGTS